MKCNTVQALILFASLIPQIWSWEDGQGVQPSSGFVYGHAASSTSVSEYLGIPYARAPIGELRFSLPQSYKGNSSINGTSFGFSCSVAPTHSTKVSKNGETNANLIAAGIQLLKATAQIGEQFSEDCLTLNVVNDNIEAFGGDPSQITIYSVIQLVVHL